MKINIQRRLEALERRLVSEPILLLMPNGRTETLRGPRYFALDLFRRACEGERTSEVDLIAQSVSSFEPGRAHMLDLVRGVLANPPGDAPSGDGPEGDEAEDAPLKPAP